MNGPGRRTLRDRQPKYLTIYSDLRERIMSGQWSPGHPLPAQRGLAGEFGVSIMTVRQALQLLTDDGLIDTRHGNGTYVAAHYAYDLGNLRSFASDLTAQGAEITTQLLGKGITEPPAHVAARLGDPGEVLWLRRLRLVSERPLIVQTSYLPVQQVGQIDPSDLIDPGLYTVLAQRGLTVVRAEETISMTTLSPADAVDLDRPGASHALLSRRTSFTAEGAPVVDDYALLAGDAVAITVNRSSGQLDVRYELTVPHGENRGSANLPPDYLRGGPPCRTLPFPEVRDGTRIADFKRRRHRRRPAQAWTPGGHPCTGRAFAAYPYNLLAALAGGCGQEPWGRPVLHRLCPCPVRLPGPGPGRWPARRSLSRTPQDRETSSLE